MSKRAMANQVASGDSRWRGDDEGLISRARDGDAKAREALWLANRRWVAAIILAHRPRFVDVEDLMQDVAFKFVSRIDTLRDVAAFKPWLRRITINACRGAARREQPAQHLRLSSGAEPRAGEVGLPPAEKEHGRRTIEDRDDARQLYERVLSLPSEYSEPLILRSIQGMSYQEISEILELPVTTIETRLARARRMLREELGEDDRGGGAG